MIDPNAPPAPAPAPTPAPAPSPSPAPEAAPAPAPTPAPAPAPTPAPAGDPPPPADANPWWGKPDLGLDQDTANFYAGRNAPSLAEALKSGMHAHKAVTDRNVLAKPDPAKLEEWGGWKDLGWVENREEYKPATPKADAPEGYTYDEGLEKTFVDACHAARVPVSAVEKVLKQTMGADFERFKSLSTTMVQQEQQATQALQTKWGPQYEANKTLAQRAFKSFAPAGMDAAVLDEVMGASGMVELFHNIGAAMGEEKLVLPGAGGGLGARSETTIRAELNQLQSGEADALTDPRNLRHGEVNSKRRALLDELARVGGR